MIERIKGILITPPAEWEKISNEKSTMMDIFLKYYLPLAIIPIAAVFIGWSFIGYEIGFGIKLKGIELGLRMALVVGASMLGSFFISAFVVDALAPTFKSEKNINRSSQLVAYSFTPALIAGVFYLLPSLGILAMLCGLYGLYILYMGIPKMKNTPQEQTAGYFVVALATMIVSMGLINYILQSIFVNSYFYSGFGRF